MDLSPKLIGNNIDKERNYRMRILITGAAGFLGSHLSDRLLPMDMRSLAWITSLQAIVIILLI